MLTKDIHSFEQLGPDDLFYFSMKTSCGHSLVVSWRGASYEYHKLHFHEAVRKISIFFLSKTKKVPYLELWTM